MLAGMEGLDWHCEQRTVMPAEALMINRQA
jgi:hypothetical protein